MIPIHDTLPSKTYPVANTGLILLNVFAFFTQLAHGRELDHFIYIYGLVPARYSIPEIAAYFDFGHQVFSFISYSFLHGGFLHILGNLWFLHIFGDNVEEHLGPFRYLVFYLLCAVTSGATHVLLNVHSNVPTIGASGAVAGVMGAYFLLYPGARILTLIPIIIIPYFVELPAFFFLAIWFFFQFLNATGGQADVSGVAWWAHIGGFLFGMVLLKGVEILPATGVRQRLAPMTRKRTTHRLQLIQPTGPPDDPNLYGTLRITPHEAVRGSRKVVNIPWGFQNRLYRVNVPAGMASGKVLRLKGMGKITPAGDRGDLLLTIEIQP